MKAGAGLGICPASVGPVSGRKEVGLRGGGREMAGGLRGLDALVENPGSVPSIVWMIIIIINSSSRASRALF